MVTAIGRNWVKSGKLEKRRKKTRKMNEKDKNRERERERDEMDGD